MIVEFLWNIPFSTSTYNAFRIHIQNRKERLVLIRRTQINIWPTLTRNNILDTSIPKINVIILNDLGDIKSVRNIILTKVRIQEGQMGV